MTKNLCKISSTSLQPNERCIDRF